MQTFSKLIAAIFSSLNNSFSFPPNRHPFCYPQGIGNKLYTLLTGNFFAYDKYQIISPYCVLFTVTFVTRTRYPPLSALSPNVNIFTILLCYWVNEVNIVVFCIIVGLAKSTNVELLIPWYTENRSRKLFITCSKSSILLY